MKFHETLIVFLLSLVLWSARMKIFCLWRDLPKAKDFSAHVQYVSISTNVHMYTQLNHML